MRDQGVRWPARGQFVSGVVAAVEIFGVFVTIDGGAEGFISLAELSWRSLRQVDEIVTVGDRIWAEVLDVDEDQQQVRLSLKATQPDPFPAMAGMVGQTVAGLVTKLTPIGVFVRIEERPDGFEGLVPERSLHQAGVDRPGCGPDVGDRGRVRVVQVDLAPPRILLDLVPVDETPERSTPSGTGWTAE